MKFVAIIVSVFLLITLVVSVYAGVKTTGTETRLNQELCKNQIYMLNTIDKLTVAANLLVLSDPETPRPERDEFVTQFGTVHIEIAQRVAELEDQCPE